MLRLWVSMGERVSIRYAIRMPSIQVIVRADSHREKVSEESSGTVHISVRAPAQGGAANMRVREIIATRAGVLPACVRIIKGAHAPKKVLSWE